MTELLMESRSKSQQTTRKRFLLQKTSSLTKENNQDHLAPSKHPLNHSELLLKDFLAECDPYKQPRQRGRVPWSTYHQCFSTCALNPDSTGNTGCSSSSCSLFTQKAFKTVDCAARIQCFKEIAEFTPSRRCLSSLNNSLFLTRLRRNSKPGKSNLN